VLTVQQTLFTLGLNLITALGTALVLFYGAHQVIDRSLSIGELLVVLAYVAAVYTPLTAISSTLAGLQQQLIALEAALGISDAKVEVVDAPGARTVDRAAGEIVFEDVSFDYPDRKGTLREVSFRIEPGARVGVVGPTGAGKSTLVSLLPRLVDPAQGRVLLDGDDLRELTIESVRRQCSIVLQEPVLFTGTIRENIRYGDLDATDEQVVAAARAANAHDFITRLPSGYATMLGERGQTLSGGERQRVAIARAFLRDAPILILDEPTSSVDTRTEAVILDALERLMTGRTTVMIAHRLSTVRTATQILVVDEGRLVEQGGHDELLRAGGLYAEMVAAQHARPTAVVEVGTSPTAEGAALAEVELPVRTALPALAALPVGAPGCRARAGAHRAGGPGPGPTAGRGRARDAHQDARGRRGLADAALPGRFERLGYETYYVEAHGRTPSMLMTSDGDDGPALAAAYLDTLLRRFGFAGRWAYQAVHSDERVLGMSSGELSALFARADLVVNLHGGTEPLPEHAATGRLVYLETDPVQLQVELHDGLESTRAFLDPHVAFFTFGENLGRAGCGLPVPVGYDFRPTRQPVVLDHWPATPPPAGGRFTTSATGARPGARSASTARSTAGASTASSRACSACPRGSRPPGSSWRCPAAPRTSRPSCGAGASRSCRRCPAPASSTPTGPTSPAAWASSRPPRTRTCGCAAAGSATAAPPTWPADGPSSPRTPASDGCSPPASACTPGARSTTPPRRSRPCSPTPSARAAPPARSPRSASTATRCSATCWRPWASRAASAPPRTSVRAAAPRRPAVRLPPCRRPPDRPPPGLPDDLRLEAVSRRPLVLPPATLEVARTLVQPPPVAGADTGAPQVSVVVPCHGGLDLTRLCLASVLGDAGAPPFEVLVVDNASTDGTGADVAALAAADPRVRLVSAATNLGFAGGVNAGLAQARGDVLVVLNNDTLLPPGTLAGSSATSPTPRSAPSDRSRTAAATRRRSRSAGRPGASSSPPRPPGRGPAPVGSSTCPC
jgi:ABC-type multidrug transport system ATPase subunit